MDRRVKERLIGASILVVLAVLLVPALLSGPSRPRTAPAINHESAPVRTYTLEVGSAVSVAAPPAPAQPAAIAPAAIASASPPPPAQSRVIAAPAPRLESRTAEPHIATAEPPVRSSRTGPKQASGGWSIQLGSFSSVSNADHVARDARSKGFNSFVSSVGKGSKARHRVRVGPFADRAAAEHAAAQLRAHGTSAAIVAP